MRRAWLLGLATSLMASGCIVDIDFDPIGTDASVQSSWTVEGAAPTAASCAALGISNVRVRFYDGALPFDHPDLVFPCEDGAFDTRPNAVVADGLWTMQLLAIDAAGNTIAEGPRSTFDTIVEGGHIVIPSVDFEAGPLPVTRVTGTWTIDGVAPTAASCANLGVTEVGVDFGAPTGILAFPCADGSMSVDVEPGTYDVQVVALDASEAIVAMAMEETFTVAEGQTHALNAGNPIDFVSAGFDPRGTDAALDATWTIGTTAASATACEVAGAVTVEFVFYDPADTELEEGVLVAMAPCAAGAFTSTGNVLAAGTYLSSAILRDGAGAQVGRADFAAATVAADTTLDLTGADIRLDESIISFELEWETTTGGTFGGCNADIDGINWDLARGAVGATAPGDFTSLYTSPTEMEACETRLTFSAATSEPVTVGAYDLLVEGTEGSVKTWALEGVCRLTLPADGDLVITTEPCKLAYNP